MEQTIEQRQKASMEAFTLLIGKLQSEVVKNFSDVDDMDWGSIGSFASINNGLIDLVSGFDGDFATKIRKLIDWER